MNKRARKYSFDSAELSVSRFRLVMQVKAAVRELNDYIMKSTIDSLSEEDFHTLQVAEETLQKIRGLK